MKLSECKIGTLVMNQEGELGHIVGLTYSIDNDLAAKMNPLDSFKWIIPSVVIPGHPARGIHPGNLVIYEEGAELTSWAALRRLKEQAEELLK